MFRLSWTSRQHLHRDSSSPATHRIVMETYPFPQFAAPPSLGEPSRVAYVHLALFEDVSNAAWLRSRLVEVSTLEGSEGEAARDEMDYALIEGAMITSRSHLLSAVYTALQAQATESLKTRTIHSEVLYGLNLTNNITDAIKRFGVSEATKRLVLVKITYAPPPDKRSSAERSEEEQRFVDQMAKLIQGQMTSLDALEMSGGVDWQRIKKIYKLNDVQIKGVADVHALYRSIIVSSIGGKQVLA